MSTYTDAKQGINIEPDDWNRRIYRIFPKNRFCDILSKSSMALIRTKDWEDPFENFLLRCKVQTPEGPATLETILESWYGQCWSLDGDSDAIWRIYSPQQDAICASTTVRKLYEAIYDPSDEYANLNFYIGKVEYCSRGSIEKFLRNITFRGFVLGGQTRQFAQLLCVKRPEFSHEKEIRILRRMDDHPSSALVSSVRPNELFDRILLDPRLKPRQFGYASRELRRAGFKNSIDQSELYKIDEITIPL